MRGGGVQCAPAARTESGRPGPNAEVRIGAHAQWPVPKKLNKYIKALLSVRPGISLPVEQQCRQQMLIPRYTLPSRNVDR